MGKRSIVSVLSASLAAALMGAAVSACALEDPGAGACDTDCERGGNDSPALGGDGASDGHDPTPGDGDGDGDGDEADPVPGHGDGDDCCGDGDGDGAIDPGTTSLGQILTEQQYEAMFPNRDPLFAYDALIEAASYYPDFAGEGTLDQRRREVAAFLANIGHETTGGWPTAPGGPYAWGLYFTQEVGCETGNCTQYCASWVEDYPCAPGRTYQGRGPMQLSWNYNYGQFGDAIGLDLLADPDLITSDGAVAFETGIWFWMTPQMPKPSAHDVMVGNWVPTDEDMMLGRAPGFGMTINIINGGLECAQPTNGKVEDRVGFFERFTATLGVTMGPNLYCDDMGHY